MALPIWKVVRLPKGQLGIQCPRKDCGCKAVVNRQKWLAARIVGHDTKDGPVRIVGRVCTYCSMAAQIPEEMVR